VSGPAAICPTDWSGYAQAAAILFTGAAAVWAAWHVGNRQADIQARQTEIALLDRRYDAIKALIEGYWSPHEAQPPPEFDLLAERFSAAELLFPHDMIKQVRDPINRRILLRVNERILHNTQQGSDESANIIGEIEEETLAIGRDFTRAIERMKEFAAVWESGKPRR
jgi:hypothetical protein